MKISKNVNVWSLMITVQPDFFLKMQELNVDVYPTQLIFQERFAININYLELNLCEQKPTCSTPEQNICIEQVLNNVATECLRY